ncbi:hypothetical protein O9G_003221 [Rozella allomycis CSF55]|uniref:Uncharacterized protein n=1 Tax=Rozella allomycis (strain CSF55) TaxID=988480 RepID=A0A075AXK2_ROZAC|nr:hypothetical protein O9G_003221 [Rozella allomycis CSF55]|eukprot:EPZ35035.1 hypothetical protein O9G_003221 [Rozella allomycis CSF55]
MKKIRRYVPITLPIDPTAQYVKITKMDPKSDRLGNIFVSTFRVSKVSKGSSDKLFIHANCILAANDIKRDDLIAFHIREGQKYVEKEIGSSGSLFFYACSKQIVYSFKIYEVMTTRYLDVENICLEAEKLAKSNNRMDVKKYFEAVRCRFYFLNKNFQQLDALLSQWETDALVNSETDAFDIEALKAEIEFIKILTYLQQGKWALAQEILQSSKLPESNDKKYLLPSWRTNDELYVMFHIIGYLSMRHESSNKAELLLQVAEKEIQNVSNSTWKRITLFMIYCYKIETFVSQERFEEIEKCLIEFSNVSQDIDRLDQLDIWKRFLFVFALLQQARGDYEAANVFYDLSARDCIELDLKVIALSQMLQIHVIGANKTEEIISIKKALVKIVDETQPYLAVLLQIIDCISLIYYDDCVEARYP